MCTNFAILCVPTVDLDDPHLSGTTSCTGLLFSCSCHTSGRRQKMTRSSTDPNPETLFWYSFWHIIWKYIWQYMAYLFWHSIWILSYTLTFYLTFYLASIKSWHFFWHSVGRLRSGSAHMCPLRSGSRSWDPARQEKENKEKTSLKKSRNPHLAGEIRHCPERFFSLCTCGMRMVNFLERCGR